MASKKKKKKTIAKKTAKKKAVKASVKMKRACTVCRKTGHNTRTCPEQRGRA